MNKDDLFPAQAEPDNSIEKILLVKTNEFIANSNASQSSFIHELLFPALTRSGLEQPGQYHTSDEYLTWQSTKVRHINRVVTGKTNVPARWVNVWLSVLPAPYNTDARQQILGLMGALDLPDLSEMPIPAAPANIAKLLREVADVMMVGAAAAADGVYDEKDDPEELKNLSNELVDVIEASISEILAINRVVDLTDTRANLVIKSMGAALASK